MTVQQKQVRLWSFLVGMLALSLAAQTVFTSVLAAPVQSKAQTTSTASSPSKRFERLRNESDPMGMCCKILKSKPLVSMPLMGNRRRRVLGSHSASR
jgi:hypothetical protein